MPHVKIIQLLTYKSERNSGLEQFANITKFSKFKSLKSGFRKFESSYFLKIDLVISMITI